MKKGDIWIATVIYIAIGVITLTLIVTAGVPLINDMRDRNTFVQSKEVMRSIDDAINAVVSDGPGSKRALNPVIIKKGELSIITGVEENLIYWQMQTKAKIQEVSPTYKITTDAVIVEEKNLRVIEYSDPLLVDYYIIKISSDYSHRVGGAIRLIGEGETSKLTGKFGLIISNEGIDQDVGVGNPLVNVKIKVI